MFCCCNFCWYFVGVVVIVAFVVVVVLVVVVVIVELLLVVVVVFVFIVVVFYCCCRLGPFTHAQMSVWHEHGYLDGALQVKRGVGEEEEGLRVEDFQPLSNYIGSDF